MREFTNGAGITNNEFANNTVCGNVNRGGLDQMQDKTERPVIDRSDVQITAAPTP
jgi:hypothetical protein